MSGGYRLCWAMGTAAMAPQMVLEELELAYEIVEVDITRPAHRSAAFLAVNPAGTVPALILPDGQVLLDAAAICLYLAERCPETGLVPAIGDPARGSFLRRLFYMANTVQVAYNPYYNPERFSTDPRHVPAIRDRAVENVIAVWRPVEAHLAIDGPYHLGNSVSLADLYMLMLSTWFEPISDLSAIFPAVGAACDLLRQRPGVRRCLERQKSISVGTS